MKPDILDSKSFPLDALVGMPPLQLNEIYNDDSFELCKRVPAKTVDLILEDMPYNTTACEWDVKIDLQLYWETRLRILKPTGVICLTASQPLASNLVVSNERMFKYDWVWYKKRGGNYMNQKTAPAKEHELVLIFSENIKIYNPIKILRSFESLKRYPIGSTPEKKGSKTESHYKIEKTDYVGTDDGLRNPSSIITFSIDEEKPRLAFYRHPTRKPVGLFEYLIRTYTNERDLVFDGFGGSGTTAIAAHKSKRNFIVIEKEKKYFDLAVRRLDIERAQYTML